MDKPTERLLLDINYYLRTMRGMARRKSMMPHDLCKCIISYSSEALDEIKEFREALKEAKDA